MEHWTGRNKIMACTMSEWRGRENRAQTKNLNLICGPGISSAKFCGVSGVFPAQVVGGLLRFRSFRVNRRANCVDRSLFGKVVTRKPYNWAVAVSQLQFPRPPAREENTTDCFSVWQNSRLPHKQNYSYLFNYTALFVIMINMIMMKMLREK
jgi:hypothetical protein